MSHKPLSIAHRILAFNSQETNLNNYFNQLGVSFESLGEQIDFRFNVNIPLENEKSGDIVIDTGEVTYFQNFLSVGTLVQSDVALRIVDFEVAPRIFDLNAWIYAGGYQMDGNGVSDMGAKGGVRGYVTNDLAVDVGIQDDDTFGTNTVFQIIWTPGRTGAGPTSWIHTLADRMREQVYRNTYVATTQVERAGGINLTDEDGQDIRVVHVDFTSTAPGDGTFENPYTSIDSANGAGSQQGDIILVHAQNGANVYSGQSLTLQDEQRFLGEGGGIAHEVTTQQMGTIDLPETFAGALNATRPTIQNAPGAAVTLAGTTLESENFDQMEVSNFVITGGANAVVSGSNGVAAVDINNLEISGTTSDAIALAAMTQTLENGTTRSRFNVTIDEIEFDNVGGDDIQLTSTTSEATISHATAISNIDSENGSGVGINLIQPQRATTINNFDWDGGTTGLGALLVTEAGTQGGVVLSNSGTGDNDITGGAVGTAYAIKLDNSAGAHTVTGTLVEDMGGDAIVVDDGSANLSFTGKITQNTNAESILSVTNGHTGTLTFTELTAGDGVIVATTGDGLQFNNADGAYVFNDKVTLSGATAVINVTDSADDATFSFLDVDIDYTGAESAVTIATSDLQAFSISGDIDVTGAGLGRPVSISNNTGGSITFNTTITSSQNGILVTDNDDTTVLFTDQVTLNTVGNTAVSLTNNTDGGVTFNDIDITTTSGSGFVASNTDNLVVTGTDNTITVTAGGVATVGLNLNTVEVGTAGVTFQTVDVTGGASGVVLNDVTGGTVTVNGGTIQNTTGIGVAITNAAGVSLNGMTINTTAGDGINIDQTNSTTSTVAINDTVISNTTGAGIDYNRSSAASGTSSLTLNGNTVSDTSEEGVRITLAGTGVTNLTIENNVVDNTSANEAILLTTSGASLKTVNLLVDGNTFSNDSAATTGSFQAGGNVTLNANVLNNSFTTTVGGSRPFEMASLNGSSRVRLNLLDNTASEGTVANDFFLVETSGTYSVEDLTDTAAGTRNTGGVSFTPNQAAFTNDAGNIPTPP